MGAAPGLTSSLVDEGGVVLTPWDAAEVGGCSFVAVTTAGDEREGETDDDTFLSEELDPMT